MARADESLRREAARWLTEHPSMMPQVDAMWQAALRGEGRLAAWLASTGSLDAWTDPIGLRSVLSGHPFPSLELWRTRATFRAS